MIKWPGYAQKELKNEKRLEMRVEGPMFSVSQSSLGLAFSKGLGHVSEKLYSFPSVSAYLKTYQQLLYLCIHLSVIPCTHSHTSNYTHNLFYFAEKIKSADWKSLHFSAIKYINLPAPLLLISYAFCPSHYIQEITFHLCYSSHISHNFSRISHYSLLFLSRSFSFYCTPPRTLKHM